MDHALGIVAGEIARLRLIVEEMESLAPGSASVTRQILAQVETVNDHLLDRSDILCGEMAWWPAWASANHLTR